MQNNTKSSVVAGVLGVFLGAFGGHDWYLGNTKKAITHTSLCVGGIILLMIGLILTNIFKNIPALNALSICVIIASYVIIVGNGIWGFIEGVSIIAGGDAGLAAKGYKVAAQADTTMTPNDPNANANDQSKPEEKPAPITPAAPNPDVLTATPAASTVAAPATQPVAKANLADEPVVSEAIPDPAVSESNSESQPKTNPISAPFAPANTTPSAQSTANPAPAPSSSEPAVSTPVTPSTPTSSTTSTASSSQEAPKSPEAPKATDSPAAPATPEVPSAPTSTPPETPTAA